MACVRALAILLAVGATSVRAANLPATRVLIEERVVDTAVASLDFTKGIDSRYKIYEVEFWDVTTGGTETYLQLQVATGCPGSCSWQTGSVYDYVVQSRQADSDTEQNENEASATQIYLTIPVSGYEVGSGANEKAMGTVKIFDPSNTSIYTHFRYSGAYFNAGATLVKVRGGAQFLATSAVSGFRLDFGAQSIQGRFRLYGHP